MAAADVIIIGGGAAGLTAALYTARRGLRTVVLSQDIGGQAATTAGVENYPGFDWVDGLELMTKFKTQAEKYGAEIRLDEVTAVSSASAGFSVVARGGSWAGPAVILAYGLTHRHLNIPGEEPLIGKGISYCATCDAPLYRGKRVAVIGGGNAAMDAALLLSRLNAQVTIVTQHDEWRGERVLIDRLQATPAIRPVTKAVTKAVQGRDRVTGLMIERNGQTETVPVDGVFVEIGFTVNPGLVRGLTELDGRNQVVVNPADNSTSIPGLFAAGDVTNVNQKQIVISAGEGAKAALGAYQYLQRLGRLPPGGVVDWGVTTPHRHEQPIAN